MNPDDDTPDDPVFRAEILLQRYFDRILTDEEGLELLDLWKARPETAREALRHYEVDHALRFFARMERNRQTVQAFQAKIIEQSHLPPIDGPFVDERDTAAAPAALSDFAAPGSIPLIDFSDDADIAELARLAAESPGMLPFRTDGDAEPAAKPARTVAAKTDRPLLPMTIAVSLLVAMFGILIFYEWKPRDERSDGGTTFNPPALVVNLDNVRWHRDTKAPRPGEPLLPGMLRFESGTVELLFYSGVRGIVEGPAEFVLLDDSRVFCKQGRWSVTVPPQGQGFEIQAPHLTVRDLGTRFYAAIEKDRCDVHVVEGVVETERSNGDKAVFQTGAGAAYRGGEVLERISGLADYFVSPVEMRRRSDAVLFRHRPPSAGGVADLRSTAIRTVDFSREPVGDATLVGGERVEGPTPGSKAFRFTGRTDRIRLKPLGKLRSMTAVVRLRIDRLNDEMNPILMSEGSVKNGLVWHLLPQGQFLVGLRTQSRHSRLFRTPAIAESDLVGRYVQLALAIDGEQRRISVYLNGDLILSDHFSSGVAVDLSGVGIGCWTPQIGDNNRNQTMDGEIAQTLIFDRALGLEEIRLLQQ